MIRTYPIQYNTCNKALKPFSEQQKIDSSKLKKFADNNLKFHVTGRKFSQGVENTVGKGQIVCNKQLLLFTLFSKDLYCRKVKTKDLFEKGLKTMLEKEKMLVILLYEDKFLRFQPYSNCPTWCASTASSSLVRLALASSCRVFQRSIKFLIREPISDFALCPLFTKSCPTAHTFSHSENLPLISASTCWFGEKNYFILF